MEEDYINNNNIYILLYHYQILHRGLNYRLNNLTKYVELNVMLG